jgi:hypothetical protein
VDGRQGRTSNRLTPAIASPTHGCLTDNTRTFKRFVFRMGFDLTLSVSAAAAHDRTSRRRLHTDVIPRPAHVFRGTIAARGGQNSKCR